MAQTVSSVPHNTYNKKVNSVIQSLTGIFQPSSSNCNIIHIYWTTWYKSWYKRSSLSENYLQIIINVKYILKLLHFVLLLQKLLSLNTTLTTLSGIVRRHELLYPPGMSYPATNENILQVHFDEPSINVYPLFKLGWNLHWACSAILCMAMPTFSCKLQATYLLNMFVLYHVMLHVYQKLIFT